MEARTYSSTLEESAIIERVARIVSSVRGTKPDYARLAAELEQAIPFDIFGVVLLRHDRQAVRVIACRRESGAWTIFHHQHPLSDSKLEQMLQTPALVVKDYPNGLDGAPALSGDALSGYHQLRSTVIVPLVVEEHILGTLELGSTAIHTYSDKNLQRLINAVARVLAAAIESAQLGGSAEIQNRQRQALKDVSSALASKMDLPTILNQIVVGVTKALNVASAIIMLDRRDGRLYLEAQSGLDRAALNRILGHGGWRMTDQCIVGRSLLHRQSFVSQDIANDERFPASRLFSQELGIYSILSHPLATEATVYGALLLCSPEPGGFTPLKADILSLFASQATVAIHNGVLLEIAQQHSRLREAVEQLEQSYQRDASYLNGSDKKVERLQDEYKLFMRVREEAQRAFGISFANVLHLISNFLLTTPNEQMLQAVLQAKSEKEENGKYALAPATTQQQEASDSMQHKARGDLYADTLSLLAQTAEAALVRAGMVGELSKLLMQLKQSTDGVKDAWFVVNLDSVCSYMNPAAEVLCGVRLDDLTAYDTGFSALMRKQERALSIENVFEKLLPRVRNAEEVHSYLQKFAQGSIYRQELRCVLAVEPARSNFTIPSTTKKGSFLQAESASDDRHYHFIRYPLYNQQGQLEASALQVRDVTEQVRDEKNRSALLSSVSHDLRTPLTTIKAAVTGLLQADIPWSEQDRKAMLEDIDIETDHLTVLVSALVELSRIEMGALNLEREWCDIVEVAYGAVAKLKRVLGSRSVRIQVQSSLPLIYIDHVQIERVFYNLIENAADRSPEEAEILVSLDATASEPRILRVNVVDRGKTIPEDERERIFTSFHSMQSYSKGLGLAICKGIVEAHQGQIWVEGAGEDDTCFIFELPVHPYSATHNQTQVTTSSNKGRSGGKAGALRLVQKDMGEPA
ncbi:MAG TPA: GAF domain-containing protein [Ktedonosporobacter sp.]|nr:GAF domain-containing protein [Ktedonosporobacter sp.]